MPSPHAHSQAQAYAHQPASASANTSLPASAYNFQLNTESTSNLSARSASYSASSSTSRSTTPASHNNNNSVSSRRPPYPQQQQQQHHHHQQQQQHHQQPLYDSAVPISRTAYGSAHTLNAKSSHVANSAPHISSALNYPPSSQPTFSPSSLPRSSSLLPPPRITVNESQWKQQHPPLYDPFNASALAEPVNERDDEPVSPRNNRRRGSRTHSRSSSLGGLSDGFRNLNRWSISTASSRASNATPSTRHRFSRRLSIDSTTLFSQSHQAVSPRRLHKGRPTTAGGTAEERRPSIPPLETLPPILTLPSLDQEDIGRAVLSGQESSAESHPGRLGDDSAVAYETSYLSTSPRATPDSSLPRSAFNRGANMPHIENGSPTFVRGHQRSRSQGMKSSTDSATSPRSRDRAKQPSQKVMLSRALQKANTAVQLDNAQNFEGARTAYCEACDLLHQVLQRTPGDEDKRKLEAIRKTYASRVEELDQMLPEDLDDGKALPQTPASNSTGYRTRSTSVASTTDDYSQPTRQRSDTGRSQQSVPNYARPTSAAWRPQMSTGSPKAANDAPRYVTPTPGTFTDTHHRSQSSFSQRSPRRGQAMDQDMFLARPMDNEYMPQPLSPRRQPGSPPRAPTRASPDVPMQMDFTSDRHRLAPDMSSQRGHQRSGSHESISWLDPIDESGGSSASSVHSRTSSMGVRRKHIRAVSGDTEAEFDAALDDAIEAAYDDGYEPAPDAQARAVNLDHVVDEDDVVAQALRKVQLAKERVRQSELEMQRLATDRDQRMRALQEEEEQTLPEGFYDGSDSDEEERMLEEMTDGYAIEDFALGDQSRPRVPRESDSSELTSRTWHSSTVSNPPTANTALSTVSEVTHVPALSKSQAPIAPPPTQSLPKLPTQRPASSGRDNIRDRRLSGQNAKQLKIETQKLGPRVREPATAGPTMQNPELPLSIQPKTAGLVAQQRQTISGGRPAPSHRGPSPIPSGASIEGAPPTPSIPTGFQDSENRSGPSAASRPPTLRKNYSSSSLKNMKSRKPSTSNIDDFSELSPSTTTPVSNPFASATAARLPALPSLPTPVASAFRDRVTSGTGGFHLFDSDIHSVRSPTEPAALSESAPAPLEPCPKETMLRPFWLMRALYQTLCHPKGGYVSNKLFVPRDAWRTKGVKIKNVEDKISQCDLLTAALQKLDRVNSDDADAVLEEMQSLETVLEQVQAFLTRRLGNDVGVQGAGAMFKDADGPMDGQDGKPIPRNNSVSSKGAFSWKRLRNKTSSTAISSSYQSGPSRKESSAAEAMVATLPFTDYPTSRPSKRDVMSVQFSGPNAHYMAALARLFDAAQSIDQIARQVEDPGLRHQDKTQVGLELSTRHAAEFFAFYVCRFVLQDLTMLLDKFIKRGSEWVLV